MDPHGAWLLRGLIEERGPKKPWWKRQASWISGEIFKEHAWEKVRPYLCVQLRKPLGKKAWIGTDGKPLCDADAIAKFAVVFLHVYATNDVLELMDTHKIPRPEFALPERWFSDRIGDPEYLNHLR